MQQGDVPLYRSASSELPPPVDLRRSMRTETGDKSTPKHSERFRRIDTEHIGPLIERMLTDIGGKEIQQKYLDSTNDTRLQNALARAHKPTDQDRPPFPEDWQPDFTRPSRFKEGTNVEPGQLKRALVQLEARTGTRYMEVETFKKQVESLIEKEGYKGYQLERMSGSMAEFQSTLMHSDTRSVVLLLPNKEGNGFQPFHMGDIRALQAYLHRLEDTNKLPSSGELLLDHLPLREPLLNGRIHWLHIRQEKQDFRVMTLAASAEVAAYARWYTSGANESQAPSQTCLALKKQGVKILENRFAELLPRLEGNDPVIRSRERFHIDDVVRALGGEIKAPIEPYFHNGEWYTAVGKIHQVEANLHQQGQNDDNVGNTCFIVSAEMAIVANGRGDEMQRVYHTDGTEEVRGVTEHDLLRDLFDLRRESESDRPITPQGWDGVSYDERVSLLKQHGLQVEMHLENDTFWEPICAIAEGHDISIGVNWGLTRLYQAYVEGRAFNTLEGHAEGWINHTVYADAFLVDREGFISHIVMHDSDSNKTEIYPIGVLEWIFYQTLPMEETNDPKKDRNFGMYMVTNDSL